MGVTCYLINCDFDLHSLNDHWASQVVLVVKNLSASAGDLRDVGSILGSGRAPEGGHDNPFQYSCLENPMDRGAWRATVHRMARSCTRLSNLARMYILATTVSLILRHTDL